MKFILFRHQCMGYIKHYAQTRVVMTGKSLYAVPLLFKNCIGVILLLHFVRFMHLIHSSLLCNVLMFLLIKIKKCCVCQVNVTLSIKLANHVIATCFMASKQLQPKLYVRQPRSDVLNLTVSVTFIPLITYTPSSLGTL